ncbi:putative RNA-binding protein [Ophiocordyceps camponoti-floridani]|uniref:Putative RNA-binding protein n=1 Tax=Ophiocordyceps camponoti-floridani TaxID=2030778 RepID=A0A8H4Q6M9_9HYPO|nr:putative RNA-binding protein [Ophiocordyceps camponoti-floridani]
MAPGTKKAKPTLEPRRSLRTATKAAVEASSKPKRKAVDESSPISLKKQKSVKPTPAREKPAVKESKAVKSDKPSKPTEEPPAGAEDTTIRVAESSSDSEDEGNNGVLLLAEEMDSGDEEGEPSDGALFQPGQAVGKIPSISKDVVKSAKPFGKRGVVYIGRIPHGFYEYEMRQYLSQFGPVTRLRLSRNKRTGASKHFAFVEFEDESTAEIVAKTMDNYLLFGHILKVKMVPESQIHADLWKGANRRFKKVPWEILDGRKLAEPRSASKWEIKLQQERQARTQRAGKLKALGYEFETPELKAVPIVAPTEIKAIEAAPQNYVEDEVVVKALEEATGEQAEEVAENTTISQARKASKKSSKSSKAKSK